MDLPRVTEVLQGYSGIEHVPADVLKNAAARGTVVHGLCSSLARGAFVPEPAEDLAGYVESYKLWVAEIVHDFVCIEERFQCPILKFTGQVDMVILGKGGQKYLVDLKTGARPQKTHPVQMAAYEYLLAVNGIDVDGVFLVYLHKDGNYPMTEYYENLTDELHAFMCALDAWYHFHRGRKYDREKEIRGTQYFLRNRRGEKFKCLPKNPRSDERCGLHSEGNEDGQ